MNRKAIMTDTLFWIIVAVIVISITVVIISGIKDQSCGVLAKIFAEGC